LPNFAFLLVAHPRTLEQKWKYFVCWNAHITATTAPHHNDGIPSWPSADP
jgi:hypothetical protein